MTSRVVINDKHIETIVRQMLKGRGKGPWWSELLSGEVIDLLDTNKINEELRNSKKISFEKVLLRLPSFLPTNSFISAASSRNYQSLTDASIKGKTDTLEGLKENVIVGRLVPAGTGLTKLNKQARDQDKARLEN